MLKIIVGRKKSTIYILKKKKKLVHYSHPRNEQILYRECVSTHTIHTKTQTGSVDSFKNVFRAGIVLAPRNAAVNCFKRVVNIVVVCRLILLPVRLRDIIISISISTPIEYLLYSIN